MRHPVLNTFHAGGQSIRGKRISYTIFFGDLDTNFGKKMHWLSKIALGYMYARHYALEPATHSNRGVTGSGVRLFQRGGNTRFSLTAKLYKEPAPHSNRVTDRFDMLLSFGHKAGLL